MTRVELGHDEKRARLDEMRMHQGERVLVTIGEERQAHLCVVEFFSPSGSHVLLAEAAPGWMPLGWWPIELVRVVDVFGDPSESIAEQVRRGHSRLFPFELPAARV